MNKHSLWRLRAAFALILGAGASLIVVSGARAQAPATKPADETVMMEKFTVTGSNIPSAGETPVAPVTVLGQAQIGESGVNTNVLDLIAKMSPQFTGNANLGNSNGNINSGSTNGGSTLALRNLATLVLVNGRRMAVSAVAAVGATPFVDVNAIPVSAIDRIEVLQDGASAIYGSDAVGGVVNIILKADYQGGEVGGRIAYTTNSGHYKEQSLFGVTGGQLGRNGPKITFSYEWNKTDPIYNYQRPFATPSYGTTNFAGVIETYVFNATLGKNVANSSGYYFLNPSLNAPTAGATLAARGYLGPYNTSQILQMFNLAQFVTMELKNEKKIATANLTEKLSDKISLFGDFIFARTDTLSQLNAQPVSVHLQATDTGNILGQEISVRNRFTAFPRQYIANTDSLRSVVGLKGDLTDQWSWETAVNYSDSSQDFTNAGLIRTAGRLAAVAAGKLALFARSQPAGALDGVLGQAFGNYTSTLTSWDFKFVGTDVLQAPGGGVGVAVGAEVRKESLSATSDPDSQSATFAYDSGTSIDPFDQKRHVTSFFGETRIPIVGKDNRIDGIYSAELTLAARHERYSDAANPTVPKIAIRYQPFGEDLLFRATYSKSFSAPTLFELNAPTGIGYTNPLAEFGTNQANEELLPATGLKPTRSVNYSAGFVWTPKDIKGLSVSIDYFNVTQTDVISNFGATGVVDYIFHDVDTLGSASRYASMVHIGDFTGPTVTVPGQISSLGLDNIYYVLPAASNIGAQKLQGADIKISYELPINGGSSKIKWDSTSTWYRSYDVQAVLGAPYTTTAGLVTQLNGTIPKLRTYNVLTYTWQNLSAEVAHTYLTSLTDTTVVAGYDPNIPAYSVFDASVSYQFKASSRYMSNLDLTVGVNNIGDKLPPLSATFNGLSNADIGTYSPIGRLWYIAGKYKF